MTTATRFTRQGKIGAQYMGDPDGPMRFIPSLGMEVPTYIDPRHDLRSQYRSAGAHKPVDYHVPVDMRGAYKPKQLADYDPEQNYPTLTDSGKVRCGGLRPDGQICQKAARNRSGFCSNHGGALHPADKLFSSARGIAPSDASKLSRLQKVELGIIPVSELSDEEIARQQVKEDDGTFSVQTKMLSAKIMGQMRSEFFERADTFVRQNVMDMLEEMRKIALSPVEEAKDKITAITWLTERALGKTPDVIITNRTDSPFDELIGDVTGGSRDAYRQQRGLTNFIEGEVVSGEIIEGEDEEDEPEDSDGYGSPTADRIEEESGSNVVLEFGNGEATLRDSPEDDNESISGGQEAEPSDLLPAPIDKTAWAKVTQITDIAKEKRDAKERIKRNRSRKYAARAQGADSLENLWFEVTFPSDKRLIGTGTHRLKLISPDEHKTPRMR